MMRRLYPILLSVCSLFCHITVASPVVDIVTSMGTMRIELFEDKAPKTVENFIRYIEIDYYNDLVFHRVIDDWVIQAGGYDAGFRSKDTLKPIRNEATNRLKNLRGTVAMARMGDPHSADSQFFINLKNNHSLDHRARTLDDYGYTVFGKVIEGMDVADAIGDVVTHEVDGFEDVPITPVVIKEVRMVSGMEPAK